MKRSERETVEAAVSGDRDALIELLEEHGPKVRSGLEGSIPKRFRSLLSADDVMQQAYTDAFRNVQRFENRGDGAFGGWLSTLAKRNLVDALRGLEADKRGGNRQRVDTPNDASYASLFDVIADSITSPSAGAARGEARGLLEDCIAQLPEDYRRLIEMYDLEGRPIAEVAEALGRSVGAVYMLRSRAHRRLAELLGAADDFLSGKA